MSTTNNNVQQIWKISLSGWLLLLGALVGLTALFHESVSLMVLWWGKDEYSHGYMIPLIVAFLIWQRKDVLEQMQFTGSWGGIALLLVGILLYFAGNLNSPYILIQYGYLLALAGLLLAFMGRKAFRVVWVPLLILAFMVPLPNIIYRNLSAALQLVSSEIGVAVIRLFDISVYLEGNVIDLGSYKLQVVEACSGLRYLFPLMTLGFIASYFFHGAFWKRAVIFLSSIPITVLMNSFRIGAIGIMVEFWGQSMAEGFLHDFEGWVVFMACTGLLVLEMWLLARIGKDRKPLREAFGLEFPAPVPQGAITRQRPLPAQLLAGIGLLIVAGALSLQTAKRAEVIPERASFSEFPEHIGNWSGERSRLEQIYLDELKLDDYILVDYTDGGAMPVNFYAAYYSSQITGESSHSPRNCLPGGGWQISSSATTEIPDTMMNGTGLVVNRFVIKKGEFRQLVYYWFQGRGRIDTNEFVVKWHLFWDALTRSRTDGALVRLVTQVPPGSDIADADRRLVSFARDVSGLLDSYIPE